VTFAEASAYLLSLGNEVSAMKLGLENIRVLLRARGSPQNTYLKIQVAGTNGKGSVCAFLNSICLRAGVRTGLYTSPHLSSITERIRINGKQISEKDFARLAADVRGTAEDLLGTGELQYRPTFFEQVTAIALSAFQENGVELAILETGLGGRLDATTAAESEIAAISRIDFDHQEYLGSSIEEIATEKAGIVRHGSKVVLGEQSPEAMNLLLERCHAACVEPILAGSVQVQYEGGALRFVSDRAVYNPVWLSLAGSHQIENAKIAICLAEVLQANFDINIEDIVDGLGAAKHPGRLEKIGRYLLDGAHNPAGAAALSRYLGDNDIAGVAMIFGAMREKDAARMLESLIPWTENIILTRPTNDRAADPHALAFDLLGAKAHVFTTNSVAEAIALAEQVTEPNELIVVAGSLYLIGEARDLLLRRNARDTQGN
jgi:dihydrofolate synthase / folylpolyglutamate synthase